MEQYMKLTKDQINNGCNFLKILKELEDTVKKGYLQRDPNNSDNILVYRNAGVSSPEGWYSEDIMEVAKELLEDKNKYNNFKMALKNVEELGE